MLTRCRLVLQTALVASCVAEEVYSVSRELIGLAHLREFNTSCANTTVGCKLVKGLATVPTVKAGETNFAITYHTDDVPVFLTDDGICSYSHSTGTETCLGFPTLLAGTMRHIGFNRNTSILWGVHQGADESSISLVKVKLTGGGGSGEISKPLATLSVSGTVTAAYYAPSRGHYCVVVKKKGTSSQYVMGFFDTNDPKSSWEVDVQPDYHIQTLAINYLTENIYTIAINGTAPHLLTLDIQLDILHMSGKVQSNVAVFPQATATRPKHFAASVIDNAANVMYVAMGPPIPSVPAATCTGPFASNKTSCAAEKLCCCAHKGPLGCKSDGWLCCDGLTETCADGLLQKGCVRRADKDKLATIDLATGKAELRDVPGGPGEALALRKAQ